MTGGTNGASRYGLYVSVFVLEESNRGDALAADARGQVLKECQVLPYPPEAEELTRAILASRWIPAKAAADAAHIAISSVHAIDFLLTWNCRHIANAATVEKIRGVCIREGYSPPVICTPHELML